MNQEPQRAKAIMLVHFEEEQLPTGRKLLHCIFKARHSDHWYKWTPSWGEKKGQHGAERLFLRAFEIEHWNDPEGVWNEELERAAEEVSALREFKLPVRVVCSGLTALDEEDWAYKISVSIVENGTESERNEPFSVSLDEGGALFRVGPCTMSFDSFKDQFLSSIGKKRNLMISKRCLPLYESGFSVGICFSVWVPHGLERLDYLVLGREVASFVRSYLRRALSDFEAMSKGFDE